jgi:transmembrane sensor
MSKVGQDAHQDVEAQAIAWRIRLLEGRGDDWEAFVRWLELDPAHSAAYDEVALADQGIPAAAFSKVPANDYDEGDRTASSFRPKRLGALVAVLAAILLAGILLVPGRMAANRRYEVASAAGQHLTVALGGEGTAVLNGATRLILDRDRPAFAELTEGEATFTIRHNPARSFIVVAGGQQLVDVGTRFNLVREDGRIAVDVIEGAIRLERDRQSVALEAGRTASLDEASGRLMLGRKAPADMAGWQRGQLSFSAAPLATVASDLSRNLGTDVRVTPVIAATPFTGSIRIGGGPADTVKRFALVAGLDARREGRGWTLEPARDSR